MLNFRHLNQVEESYFEHFKFAMWAAFIFLILGTVSFVHALLPWIFSRLPDKIFKYFLKKSNHRINKVDELLKQKNIEK